MYNKQIDVSSTDPVYSAAKITCISHTRTLPAPSEGLKIIFLLKAAEIQVQKQMQL